MRFSVFFCYFMSLCAYALGLVSPNDPDLEVKKMLQLADGYDSPSKVLRTLDRALDLESQLHDTTAAQLYFELGVAHGMLYNTDSAGLYLEKVLDICERTGDKMLMIGAYNGLGNVARTESRNQEASVFFQKGLEIAESDSTRGFVTWRAKLLGNIGGIFFDMDDFQSALEYSQRALGFSRQSGNRHGMAVNHTQIGYAYNALGEVDKALEHNQKSADILAQAGDTLGLIYQYYNIAGIYQQQERYVEATDYFLKCMQIAETFGEAETFIGSLYNLGKMAFTQRKIDDARKYATRAEVAAKEKNLLPSLIDAYELLYKIHEHRKDFRQALKYRNLQIALSDSLKNEESLRQINDFKIKYETANKEKTIAELSARQQIAEIELSRKNTYQLFLIASIFALALVAFYVYRSQHQKNTLREQVMMSELSELRMQIKELLGKYEGKVDLDLEVLNQTLVNPLSEREYDVFKMIFTQKTNQQMAEELYVSINTIKTHLKNIYSKLGVANRKEALQMVYTNQNSD